MNIVSKDNFKDEFERNRQEINPTKEYDTSIEEEPRTHTQPTSTDNTQHFPPRNPARRHRKRVRNQDSANPAETKQDQAPQNPAKAETEPTKADRTNEAAATGAGASVTHNTNTQKAEQPKVSTEEKSANNKKAKVAGAGAVAAAGVASHQAQKSRQDVTKSDQDNKKAVSTAGAGAAAGSTSAKSSQPEQSKQDNTKNDTAKTATAAGAGVAAGAAGAAGAASTKASQSAKQPKQDSTQNDHKKAAATGAGVAAGTAGATGAAKASEQPNTTVSNGSSNGGFLKRILPIIAAILLLGTIAIFGGMYLFNQDQSAGNDDAQLTQQSSSKDKDTQSAKEKAEKEKAAKEKAQKEKAAKEKAEKERAEKEKAEQEAAQNNVANQQDINNQYAAQNQQNVNQQPTQSAGNQSHTVGGSENLYRIAIQYYGSGSPENVEKIRQANGISGNNISNGQQLIIP